MSEPEKRIPMGTIDVKYKSRWASVLLDTGGESGHTVISTLSRPSIRWVVALSMRVPIA